MDANIFSQFPKTLQACIQFFSDEQRCIDFLATIRWPGGAPVCPQCGSGDSTYYLATQKRWKCRGCKKQFSVKVGTIFEDSAIPLTKWFPAVWLICGAKNGISSYEIGRALDVTQKSAWFMMHRVRLAMTQGSFEMGGETPVEVDETYLGGLAKNMHKEARERKYRGGGSGKTAVFGMLERKTDKRKSRVKAAVVPTQWKTTVNAIIKETVKPGGTIYSDEHGSYKHLTDEGFQHAFVAHAKEYVNGTVHTNGIECFWNLLKRSIKGTYVSIEPFHTFRYVDEQAFRFNEREGDDADRFLAAISKVAGKRVTWNELTGKEGVQPSVGNDAESGSSTESLP